MSKRIFISYRRDDAASDAGRLADHLNRRFGANRVFLDVDAIEPGTDFVEVLQASLRQTAAMLVVIGPRWTSQRAPDGTRRLDDPNDFVRLEVETALGSGIRVVPVLVQGATLPRKEDLPASLAPLVTRQTAVLDYAEFHDDVERLCDRLAPLIGRRQGHTVVAGPAVVARGGAHGRAGSRNRRIPRHAHHRPGLIERPWESASGGATRTDSWRRTDAPRRDAVSRGVSPTSSRPVRRGAGDAGACARTGAGLRNSPANTGRRRDGVDSQRPGRGRQIVVRRCHQARPGRG